ncbi:electron transfer flavoprotein subunit beta/FixA family protein [Paenibacillus athensensis]|uniref:Electron transfer flavoprotein subunit beta n=1 Tax=Paenibacillus athensensis TaxID=1967502 RepID=A0A4Y8QAP6_9BACL|nr:electron transfer flavoprotein subunit beta/FixA family protein [Paenibacillus athensensis]MCD1257505.1 electron transfer flavoprotein subunit beta/FixA family protein [Paenibacillus athensensis]
MDIFVLIKQTFDTEEKIALNNGAINEEQAKWIINPYDEYAIEEALRLRDRFGGRVTALSVGPERVVDALRTALALGADEAALIDGEPFGGDEYGISLALAAYLRQRSYDLVLGGFFSVDNGAGQVAVRLAALLDIPHAAAVTQLDVKDGVALAVRDAEGDHERFELPLPALITAQQGLNEPRYPSLPGIMKAKKKPLQRLGADELGLTPPPPKTARLALFAPPPRAAGQRLEGDAAAQAAALALALRSDARTRTLLQ